VANLLSLYAEGAIGDHGPRGWDRLSSLSVAKTLRDRDSKEKHEIFEKVEQMDTAAEFRTKMIEIAHQLKGVTEMEVLGQKVIEALRRVYSSFQKKHSRLPFSRP